MWKLRKNDIFVRIAQETQSRDWRTTENSVKSVKMMNRRYVYQ